MRDDGHIGRRWEPGCHADVPRESRRWQLAPPPRGPGTRTVSGVVFEVTETGRQPVAGASVGWEGDMDLVVAHTLTDTSGRYLLCGLPETRLDSLFALKTGYSRDGLYRIVEAGSDYHA